MTHVLKFPDFIRTLKVHIRHFRKIKYYLDTSQDFRVSNTFMYTCLLPQKQKFEIMEFVLLTDRFSIDLRTSCSQKLFHHFISIVHFFVWKVSGMSFNIFDSIFVFFRKTKYSLDTSQDFRGCTGSSI